MRFYFFKTSMEDRGAGKPEPTLRALPGQTFPDGSPVNTGLNVQAPKEPGTSPYGTRLEYPVGTVFCSTFLHEIVSQTGATFYTVYDQAAGQSPHKTPPDFHPVSDDANFQFVGPEHLDKRMQAAYVRFLAFGAQESEDGAESPSSRPAKKPSKGKLQQPLSPADSKGIATPLSVTGFTPSYDDQLDTEMGLIVMWMKRTLTERGVVNMLKKPKGDETVRQRLAGLYACGETIDTIAQIKRFKSLCESQKIDSTGLQNIGKGPLMWYLDEIYNEHEKGKECTAFPREPLIDANDTSYIVCMQMSVNTGVPESVKPEGVQAIGKALGDGWNLADMIKPEVLSQRGSFEELAQALASGAIPLPERAGAAGATFMDKLMADKKNACPKDKEGFHVDQLVWKILIHNLYRRTPTLLTGPSGTGKTEIIRLLSERTGMPLTIIPMGAITDPTEQLIGKMDLDPATNGTRFDWADFALAVQRPGIVLLDEINRCPRNGNNTLFSALDGVRQIVASGAKSTDQRVININKDCVFFATANIGSEYTGTSEIDLALKTRFMQVELDYMTPKTEAAILKVRTGIDTEDATNICIIAAKIRKDNAGGKLQNSVSVRETLRCAELVADGFGLQEAIEAVMLPGFERGETENDVDSERGQVRAIIAQQFK